MMKRIGYIGIVFLIWSCSKKSDNIEPEKLLSEVIGKWQLNSQYGINEKNKPFIEFLSDGTYIIYNLTKEPVVDKYEIEGENKIVLDHFGQLSEVDVIDDEISFKMTYEGKTVSVLASKLPTIPLTERTRQLTHRWSINNEEDASLYFNNVDDPIPFDKFIVFFTPSGTGCTLSFSKGQLIDIYLYNWKWHSKLADHLYTWDNPYDGEYFESDRENEDNNYVKIRELNTTQLKTTGYYIGTDGRVFTWNTSFTKAD
jgi:hypothetical protein